MKRNLKRFVCVALLSLILLANSAPSLLAKPKKVNNAADIESRKASASVWVVPYIVVIMGVGLGVLMLCAPSRRAEVAPKEDVY